MSNNAWVTLDGGEIGRAQAVQSEACGLIPTCQMNPILLKPSGAQGSQVIVLGHLKATVPRLSTTGISTDCGDVSRKSSTAGMSVAMC